MQKLNIKPFQYGMNVLSCYDEGSILNRDQVSTNLESILKKFQSGVKNIAAISLQADLPCEASVPHSIVNAFKNIAAIALQSGLELE